MTRTNEAVRGYAESAHDALDIQKRVNELLQTDAITYKTHISDTDS